MNKLLYLILGVILIFSCSKEPSEDSSENEVETLLIDIEQIKGKWNFSGNGQPSKGGSACDIYSVIFTQNSKTSGNFKLYITGRAIKGEFVIGPDSIKLSVSDNEIGVITQLSVQGDKLSASFNIQGYCVAKVQSQKDEEHQPDMTYIKDDVLLEMIVKGFVGEDSTDPNYSAEEFLGVKGNYVKTSSLKLMRGANALQSTWNCEGIKDLTGIEDAVNLEYLRADGNEIEFFDPSNHPKLKYLDLSNNKIKSIDLSKNIKLEYIYLLGNPIDVDTLDLSNNIIANDIRLGGFSKNLILHNTIEYPYGSMASVYPDGLYGSLEKCNGKMAMTFQSNIRNIIYPRHFFRGDTMVNQMSSFFVPQNNKMQSLIVESEKKIYKDKKSLLLNRLEIDELDLSPFENLESITLQGCDIKNINFGSLKKIKSFNMSYNSNITNIDFSGLEDLSVVTLYANRNLREIDISSNLKLQYFDLTINPPDSYEWGNDNYIDITKFFNYSDYDNLECLKVNDGQINDCPNTIFTPYSTNRFINYPSTSDCKLYITDHRIKCPNSYWDDPDCKHDFFKTSCD